MCFHRARNERPFTRVLLLFWIIFFCSILGTNAVQIVFIHSVCADNAQHTTIQRLFCVVFSFAIDTNIKNYAHLHEYSEFIPFILWTTFSSLIKFGKWKPLQTVRIIKIGNEHDTGNAKQFSNLVYFDPATNNAINISDGSRLTQCQTNDINLFEYFLYIHFITAESFSHTEFSVAIVDFLSCSNDLAIYLLYIYFSKVNVRNIIPLTEYLNCIRSKLRFVIRCENKNEPTIIQW